MKGVLDMGGAILALILGLILFFFGGLQYLVLMLVFFLLAIVVTKYQYETKRDMGLYEHQRGWENVFSNGFIPAVLAVLSPLIGPGPYVASLAAVMADKFGSEIGVLDPKNPISLFNLKAVKAGTSGAMSRIGTVATIAGATSIGFTAIFIMHISPNNALSVSLAGTFGALADTAFGIFEERGIGTKSTTNILCSIVGGIIGYLLIR